MCAVRGSVTVHNSTVDFLFKSTNRTKILAWQKLEIFYWSKIHVDLIDLLSKSWQICKEDFIHIPNQAHLQIFVHVHIHFCAFQNIKQETRKNSLPKIKNIKTLWTQKTWRLSFLLSFWPSVSTICVVCVSLVFRHLRCVHGGNQSGAVMLLMANNTIPPNVQKYLQFWSSDHLSLQGMILLHFY